MRGAVDESRVKRGTGDGRYNYHSVTCLCDHCKESYRYHNEVLHVHGSGLGCGFCQDHRYAIARVEQAEKYGEVTMSSINICERCETMSLGKAMGTVSTRTDPTTPWESKDICPGCVTDFITWFKEGESIQRDVKAYKKPYEEPKEEFDVTGDGVDTEDLILAAASRIIRGRKAIESGD